MSDRAGADRAEVRAYYASFGEREWERLERPSDGVVEFAVTTDALERHLAAGSDVLDIGGGPGRYAIWLAERGHQVTLADLSPELLDVARSKIAAADPAVQEAITVVQADACDLARWADGSFGAALSLGPFYHLIDRNDRVAAARELARVVRAGGIVFAAAMPRLTFLRRTIGLPDERHHLRDRAWLRRLLDDGVFVNDVSGRFSLGYGMVEGELEALLDAAGFDLLERLSAESLSAGIDDDVAEIIEGGGPTADAVMALMLELAGEPALLGSARHHLMVARRR